MEFRMRIIMCALARSRLATNPEALSENGTIKPGWTAKKIESLQAGSGAT
jgi:hypothetical protein